MSAAPLGPLRWLTLLLCAAGLGIGVISVIDNLLRPVFARMGALKMPMYLLFLSVFGGLAAFGTWGALIGPLLVRLAMEALAIVREEKRDARPKDPADVTPAAA